MTITLELTAEQERRLEEGTARHDEKLVRQVLVQALDAALPALLRREASQLSSAAFRSLLDELAGMGVDSPSLPDEALTREGVYGDHL